MQTSEKVDQETISHGSDSTVDDERVFEVNSGDWCFLIFEIKVESINGHKKVHGKDYWLVRWSGYGPEHDTWEPNSNLLSENVKVMCKEYLDNNRSAKRSRNRRSSGKVLIFNFLLVSSIF